MRILNSLARRTVRQLGKWRLLSPVKCSILLHRIILGRYPDITGHKDMNEVILYLTHRTDISAWPRLADKFAVRDFVAEKAGNDILVPLYAVADSPDEIDFDSLPQSFVIKTTDGFARTLIVKDKSSIDIPSIKKKLRKWMRERHVGDEPHYLKIKRRLIIERLLPGLNGHAPVDYKFICINGEPRYCLACSERSMETFRSKFTLYRLPEWTDTDGITPGWESDTGVQRPATLEKMMEISRILSKDLPFVRIDLYEVENKVFFGEITLTSCAGREMKITRKMLDEIGAQVDLSKTLSNKMRK